MSKQKNNNVEEQKEQKQPDFIEELKAKGTTILTANTRDGLAEMVNDIPADCSYGAGAVGFNPETGLYSLRIDLTNKEK